MRAVIQAVSSASVRVNGGEPRPIGPGLVILLGVKDTDTLDIVPKLAEKCAGLRIFPDAGHKSRLPKLLHGQREGSHARKDQLVRTIQVFGVAGYLIFETQKI